MSLNVWSSIMNITLLISYDFLLMDVATRGKKRIVGSRDFPDRMDHHGIVRIADTNVPISVRLHSHVLLFEGTLRSSCPIISSYPWVIKSYYIQVTLGPNLLLFGGTLRSSCAILWEYP